MGLMAKSRSGDLCKQVTEIYMARVRAALETLVVQTAVAQSSESRRTVCSQIFTPLAAVTGNHRSALWCKALTVSCMAPPQEEALFLAASSRSLRTGIIR